MIILVYWQGIIYLVELHQNYVRCRWEKSWKVRNSNRQRSTGKLPRQFLKQLICRHLDEHELSDKYMSILSLKDKGNQRHLFLLLLGTWNFGWQIQKTMTIFPFHDQTLLLDIIEEATEMQIQHLK